MPTQAAMVTMVSLVDRFQDSADFRYALYWFLQASRFGRYSGSGTTSLDEDLRDVQEATSLMAAVQRLLCRFPHDQPITDEDFLRDYGDARFGKVVEVAMSNQNHAIVIGASMGGLLAARALADFFAQVTLIERDALPPMGEHRKGVPQGKPVHVLPLRGSEILEGSYAPAARGAGLSPSSSRRSRGGCCGGNCQRPPKLRLHLTPLRCYAARRR